MDRAKELSSKMEEIDRSIREKEDLLVTVSVPWGYP